MAGIRRFDGLIARAMLLAALLIGVIVATSVAVLQAQSPAPPDESPVEKVTVQCVDAEGKPVDGAEVHLFQHTGGKDGRYFHTGPFTSDAQGRALCSKAMFNDKEKTTWDRWVYARVPGKLVGVTRNAKWKHSREINPGPRVVLQPSQSVDGRVTVPPDVDPRKIVVRVKSFLVKTGAGEWDIQMFPRNEGFQGLDTALPNIFERHPDADGRVRFDDVPVRGGLSLATQCNGLGEAQWRNENRVFNQSIELNVEPEFILSGKVADPNGKPVSNAQVAARLSSLGVNRTLCYSSTFRANADKDGKFIIRGLPLSTVTLSVTDPEGRWIFRPIESLETNPQKPLNVTCKMETGVTVSGRVFDPDGKPVEGAAMSAIAKTGSDAGLDDCVSDAQGRYKMRLPVGTADLYFNALPDGFDYPKPEIIKHLEIEKDQPAIENLDFTIPRHREDDARDAKG